MAVYVLLYIIALTGYLWKANASKQSRKLFLFIVFGLLIFFASVRDVTVGTDLNRYYYKYYAAFASASWSELQSVTTSGDWEWGFCALCKILAMISPNIQLFIAVTSICSFVPYGIFIYKNSDDIVFSTSMFIGFHIYSQSLNIVRQALAVGILLLALEELKKRRKARFVILVLLAALFHSTAIIALIYLVLEKLQFKRNTAVLLLFAAAGGSMLLRIVFEKIVTSSGFSALYGIYSSSGTGDSGGYITFHTLGMFAITLAVFLAACIFINHDLIRPIRSECLSISRKRVRFSWSKITIEREEKEYFWSENLVLYAVYFSMLFRFTAFFINVTSRLSLYFFPFLIISVPYTCMKAERKNQKIIYEIMYAAITLFFFVIVAYKAEELWGSVPYTFFWQK